MMNYEEYPVYNHRERPGIGRDHAGTQLLNCFKVRLSRDQTGYAPFRFADFIADFTQQRPTTCRSCIDQEKRFEFPVESSIVDRSAVERKFAGPYTEINESDYYYCPMIAETLAASALSAELSRSTPGKSIEPIPAILQDNWDDQYYFIFREIHLLVSTNICKIYKSLLSPEFISNEVEKIFLDLWFQAMFMEMNRVSRSKEIFLSEEDFTQTNSKLLCFLFPIPQVWVYIDPKRPPGHAYEAWEKLQQKERNPQRIDFLVTYEGQRHAIEIDGVGHYGEKNKGGWRASEACYRRTIAATRRLEKANFKVHRFTNEEIAEIGTGISSNREKSTLQFIDLLKSSGLDVAKMVFL